jgi:hypothetical protein
MAEDKAFQVALPRSSNRDASDLRIVDMQGDLAIITDGERTTSYVRLSGPELVGKDWHIRPEAGIEAGCFSEANEVTISDGEREAVFVPKDQPAREEA